MTAEVAAPTLDVPAFRTVPPRDGSMLPSVVWLGEQIGRTLDPAQQVAVDTLTSAWADGRPATLEAAVVCPRQNLKTYCLELITLTRLLRPGGDRLAVWSAHEVSTAQETFKTFLDLAESVPWLGRRVEHVSRATGREAITFRGGRRLKFKARIKTGGRGLAGDLIVLDEAFALAAEHMGSLLPILSTRPRGQVIYGSSAPLASSAILRGVMARGRAADVGAPAYVEWSAPGSMAEPGCLSGKCLHEPGTPGCVMDDESLWLRANPAAVAGRISMAYLRAERRALPPEEFARERLGWGDEPGQVGAPFTVAEWDALATDSPQPGPSPVFAADLAWDRRNGAVAVATRQPDGTPLVELVRYVSGSDALVDAAADLASRHPDARWVGSGAVESIRTELRRRGVSLRMLRPAEVESAHGQMQDAVKERRLAHLGDPVVRDALEGAVRRDSETGWVWGRRKSGAEGVDISPLYALTEALYALPPEIDLMRSFG